MKWERVNKKNRCPVCSKDTWCLVGPGVVLCMREESGRPKLLKSGEAGWLHPSKDNHPVTHQPTKEPTRPSIDCERLISQWSETTKHEWLCELARGLGVSVGSLVALRASYAGHHRAWAFPMRDGQERVVGIRLRTEVGAKFAVTGSHAGCFIPMTCPQRMTLITEGPTDTAAALDLGYYAIGRPSCSGGGPIIKQIIARQGIKRLVIIADNDEPGVKGAQTLVELLPVPCAVVCLPCKDLREFVRLGGSRAMLDNKINQTVWQNV